MSMPVQVAPGGLDAALETPQNAQAGNANGAAIDVRGHKTLIVEVTGTGFTGTVNFEGSIDPPLPSGPASPTWWAVGLKTVADGAAVTTATATGQFKMPADLQLAQFRARTSGVTGGTVTVRTWKHPR